MCPIFRRSVGPPFATIEVLRWAGARMNAQTQSSPRSQHAAVFGEPLVCRNRRF